MSSGTELLFIVALGLVVLGPKRLHIVLADVTRAKAESDKASGGINAVRTAHTTSSSLPGGPNNYANGTFGMITFGH